MKLIFAPVGIVAGLLAGLIAQKGFERLWSVFDDEEPPEPDQRDISYPKLLAALVVDLQGGVVEIEAPMQQLLQLAALRVAVRVAPDEHVGGQGREPRGDRPDVQVVHLRHPRHRGHRPAHLLDVGPRR